jgi:hypothetical protein
MTNSEIQNHLYQWACAKGFDAPYGILSGSAINRSGRNYLTVTFGRARTFDATVEVYGPTFLRLRTSSHGNEIFRDLPSLMARLETL